MKRSILRALALCLTTTVVASYAQAQADSDRNQSRQSQQGGPGATSGTYTPGGTAKAGQPVRLSKLMNTSLSGQTGQSLGQVQDIVVDPTSGHIQFVVLSLTAASAGAPGAGTGTTTDTPATTPRTTPGAGIIGTTGSGKLVAVPWRLLNYNAASQQFTANVDASRLQSAPTFSSTAWPTMDSAWMQRVYSHFGVDATGTGAPGAGTGTGTGTINPSTPGLPSTPGTPDIAPPGTPATPGTRPGAGTGTSPGGTK